jgi:hypothetical protein
MCLQTVFTVASIGLKLADGIQANKAAKAQAVYSEHQARLARQMAAVNAQRPLEQGREHLGAYLARAAQSNVDLARGSPVDAAAKIGEQAQRNHLTALHGGEVAAWHHRVEAAHTRARGRGALQGALIGAGFSLLGEASRDDWFRSAAVPLYRRAGSGFIVPMH